MKKIQDLSIVSPAYQKFIEELKGRVLSARLSAARSVNRDLILLYWDVGQAIVEKQRTLGWGESVVEMVSADLRRAFPGMTGFSPRNLRDTKRFYLTYDDEAIWRQAVAKLEPGAPPAEFLQQLVAEIPCSPPTASR